MATPSVLITPEGVFRLQAEEIDPDHYFRLLSSAVSFQPAYVYLGHIPGTRLTRLVACHSVDRDATSLTGYVGQLTRMNFCAEGTGAVPPGDHDPGWLYPKFGVRPGDGVALRWGFDPAIAWPGEDVYLVFGQIDTRAGLWAVKHSQPLKRLPMSNTFNEGRLCMRVAPLSSSGGLVEQATALVDAFEASSFSHDLPPAPGKAERVFRYRRDDDGSMVQLPSLVPFAQLDSVAPDGPTTDLLNKALEAWFGVEVAI
jgi:hypothetical protein